MLGGGAVLLVVQLRRLPDPVAEFDIALAPGLDQGPDIVGVADHGGPVSVTVAGMAVCDAGRPRTSRRGFPRRVAPQQQDQKGVALWQGVEEYVELGGCQ